jgi:hypothetical protein
MHIRWVSAIIAAWIWTATGCELDHGGLSGASGDPVAPIADASIARAKAAAPAVTTELSPDARLATPDGPPPASPDGAAPPSPPPPPDAGAARDPDPPPSAGLAAGLLLYLPLDDGPGHTSARDRSGHENAARLEGLDADRAWVAGRFGGALAFDGGRLRVEPGPSLNEISEAFTIAAWVRSAPEGDADGVILSRAAPGAGGYLYELLLEHGQPRIAINSSNGYRADLKHPRAISRGRWVHLAVTYALGSLRLYVDGELVASDGYAHPLPPEASPVIVGARERGPDDPPAPFSGQLDEVLLHARALSADEVAALAGGQRPLAR